MERIVYRKTLDVHKNGIQFTLQGFETADNMARRIEISLMESGDTIDLPLEQLVAMIYVTTPNATAPSINNCTIKDNKIIYDVLPIVEEGITEMQIKLIETSPEGAKSVLGAPRFAVEVTKGNIDDGSVAQTTTFTALEDAIAKANGVYEERLTKIEVDNDCTFRAIYADGTVYENDSLKNALYNGNALLSQSYAKGGTGARDGEDTDNSMYYSNVSRSASIQAEDSREKSQEVLDEARKHSIYTAFSVDFNTGEVKYISPNFTFDINEETGELDAEGEVFVPEDNVDRIVTEWLASTTETLNQTIATESISRAAEDEKLGNQIAELGNTMTENFNNIADYDVEKDVKSGWRYAKHKCGQVEVWFTTSQITVPAFTSQRVELAVPNGIFAKKPEFILPVFRTSGMSENMGLCEVTVAGSDWQSQDKITIQVHNAHNGAFTFLINVYATHW